MMNQEDLGPLSKESYLKSLHERLQNSIVNFKSCDSSSTVDLIWTHKSTYCDVLSVITTAKPFGNAAMRDIRLRNKEMKRIKAPKAEKVYAYNEEQNVKSRAKMNRVLIKERAEFMKKLHTSRIIRSKIEHTCAKAIQKLYRGYRVRSRVNEIVHKCEVHKKVRDIVKRGLVDADSDFVVKLSEHRQTYTETRNVSATIIQRAFRCSLSRCTLNRKMKQNHIYQQKKAIIAIQSWGRKIIAINRSMALRTMKAQIICKTKAVIIQTAFRGMLDRRRVHRIKYVLRWVAASNIQNFYRKRFSQWRVGFLGELFKAAKLNRMARYIQNQWRAFLACRKMDRMRLKRVVYNINFFARRIQSVIRGFLGRVRAINWPRPRKKGTNGTERTHNKDDYASAQSTDNIFQLAAKNDAAGIQELISLSGNLNPKGVDKNGDTLLTIAAKKGHMDIASLAFQLECNVVHRNKAKDTALTIAVHEGHPEIAKLVLSKLSTEQISETDHLVMLHDELLLSKGTIGAEIFRMFIARGLNPVTKNPDNFMTPLLLACYHGNEDCFNEFFSTAFPETLAEDIMGQNCFHKACQGSERIVCTIISNIREVTIGPTEENPDSPTAQSKIDEAILSKDKSGKNCFLLAALAGQIGVISTLKKSLSEVKVDSIHEKIKWSNEDIDTVLKLAEKGTSPPSPNGFLQCLDIIYGAGFDTSFADTKGLTVLMAACKFGRQDMVDYLMKKEVDFTVTDSNGMNAIHYAAQCPNGDILDFIFSQPLAGACGVVSRLIASTDSEGQTPLHIVAKYNKKVSLVIGRHGLDQALATRDKTSGLTPLLIACSYNSFDSIRNFVELGAVVCAVDDQKHGCIWHLYHRNANHPNQTKRPIASEYVSGGTSDVKQETLQKELDLVEFLLEEKCSFFSQKEETKVSDLLSCEVAYDYVNFSDSIYDMEPADIAAKEKSLQLFKMLPKVLSPKDCWKAVISAIRHDDGTSASLVRMIQGGLASKLSMYTGSINEEEFDESDVPTGSDAWRKLSSVIYRGYGLAAWCLALRNMPALHMLIERGLSISGHLDSMGNTILHFCCMYGNKESLEIMMDDLDSQGKLDLEIQNFSGATPAMEGARAGDGADFHATKALIKKGADARTALRGKYWGWILALARKREADERKAKGESFIDDNQDQYSKYFSFAPDPEPSIALLLSTLQTSIVEEVL